MPKGRKTPALEEYARKRDFTKTAEPKALRRKPAAKQA